MKNTLMIIFSLTVMCGSSCANDNKVTKDGLDVPAWLDKKIEGFKNEPPKNPPLKITKWKYNENIVYYMPPYCCDIMSELYDYEGTLICHPDGGLTGNGDGQCQDFFQKRTEEQIIWEDKR